VTLPTVSVVIPTHDRRDRLTATVAAIAADPHPMEIVVVVDGGDDGSMELLHRLSAEEPRLRPVWQENGGEGAARHAGVTRAAGEVVLLLDDDVLAGPGLASGHAKVHARVRRSVVLGYMPVIRPQPRRPGDFATHLYGDGYERACARYEADPDSVIGHLWAGNMSLRRADALAVGLDGGGNLGHADRAFGLRCVRAGLGAVFDRSLAARHAHRQDVDSFARQARRQGRSRRLLSQQYPDLVHDGDPRDDLPATLRPVIAACAAPGVHRVAVPALQAGVRAAGLARLWPAETALARLLRQAELVGGYHGRR
jgi:glycosyltransferase involved in cell wall biosynthesis